MDMVLDHPSRTRLSPLLLGVRLRFCPRAAVRGGRHEAALSGSSDVLNSDLRGERRGIHSKLRI